jgi:hypothetical protein
VGSKTFNGVWFTSYVNDHPPPHVHGEYAETRLIVDLLADGTVQRSQRWDAVRPAGARRSDVRRILEVAAEHAAQLKQLWEKAHGGR